MRWVFGLLVLVNVTYWMWASWYAEPEGAPNPPQARTQINPDKMRPISEPGVIIKARAPQKEAPQALTDIAPPKRCFVIGQFAVEGVAKRAHAALAARGLAAVLESEAEDVTNHRIYLPSLASREAAEKQRRKLTRLGFKDHALIREKGMENAISLGVFSVRENAIQHQQVLRKKGIKTKLQVMQHTRQRYQLGVKSESDLTDTLTGQPWGEEAVSVTEIPCEPQAATSSSTQKAK